MFLNYFNTLMLKLNLKKYKNIYYFNLFKIKKYFKKQLISLNLQITHAFINKKNYYLILKLKFTKANQIGFSL